MPVDFLDPGFRFWHIQVGNVVALQCQERLAEERVRQGRSVGPYVEQFLKIGCLVFPKHCPRFPAAKV